MASKIPAEAWWREYQARQVPRRDMRLREWITAVVLILVVWMLDLFVVRPAFDRDYFTVQRVVRQHRAHCRDMVINRIKPGYYKVWTCKEERIYHVIGDDAVLVERRPEQVPSCPR